MASKCKYRLVYFNGKGRAETIRLVFAAAGIQYEDKRIEMAEWPALKPNTPWGSLPILEVEGKTIGQSLAIAKFAAREGGLAGKSPIEQALVESVTDAITDLREKSIEAFMCKDETKKAALTKTFFEQTLPTALGNLDKFIHDRHFLVGEKLSLADLHFFAVVDPIVGASADTLKQHPKLDQLYKRVSSDPKVAEYLKKRPQTAF